MKEYTVKIHYTDKDGAERTFISEKLADSESEAAAKATKLFNSFKNTFDSIISIEVERVG